MAGYLELLRFKEELKGESGMDIKLRMIEIKKNVIKSNYIDRVQLKHEINQITTDYELYTKTITSAINKISASNYDKIYREIITMPVRDIGEMQFIGDHIHRTFIDSVKINGEFLRLIRQLCLEYNFQQPEYFFYRQLLDNMEATFNGSKNKRQQKNNMVLLCELYSLGVANEAIMRYVFGVCKERFDELYMELLKIVMERLPGCKYLYGGIKEFLQEKLRLKWGKQHEFLIKDCLEVYEREIVGYERNRAREVVAMCLEGKEVEAPLPVMEVVERVLELRHSEAQRCKPLLRLLSKKQSAEYCRALDELEEYIDDIALDNPAASSIFNLLRTYAARTPLH